MFLDAFAFALDRVSPTVLVEISVWIAGPIVLLIWTCAVDRWDRASTPPAPPTARQQHHMDRAA